MAEVIDVLELSKKLKLVHLKSAYLSKAAPGQFFVMQYSEKPERTTLFIMDADKNKNIATFLIQKSEDPLIQEIFENIKPGQKLHYVEGPAGKPFANFENKNILFVSINWGFGGIYSIAKNLKPKNHVDLAFINTDAVQSQDLRDFLNIFDNVDDYESIYALDKSQKHYDMVICAGSNDLAKELANIYENTDVYCAVITRMLCTVGLCLACRIQYDGQLKLPCVEGPWLDAKKIDFEDLNRRHLILKEALVRNRKG